eukprot:TRINITY_DN66869_c0_g1_i1.p1 TRINITY_DN66869_c0_g1~~TRINITY_DN66869_c0_g1_i1.p1  ORF type:complete len:714 (+),score=72.97 TRINITY_DN66869_c0_g1_i1:111-2252(+)
MAAKASCADTSEVWVVADPRSQQFGQVFSDQDALANGVHRGSVCLVTTDDGVVMLEKTSSPQDYLASYQASASSVGLIKVTPKEVDEINSPRKLFQRQTSPLGYWQRLGQLAHFDLVALRPTVMKRKVSISLGMLIVYMYGVAERYYYDAPPSIGFMFLVSLFYPLLLYAIARLMRRRMQPVESTVFELLLALDVCLLAMSVLIFVGIVWEAYQLDMLVPPWGHRADQTSPALRKFLWLHYHCRQIELLDTVIRICQKKFKAYGALHVYLRIVFLWGWLCVCRLGGGDAYFLVMVDAGVSAVRFLVFTLTLLRWNWNIHVDFGLHAPKMPLFRKEHLLYLQIGEFALLALHACYCGFWGTVPRWLAAIQALVMMNGMSIFTDFYYSRDSLHDSARASSEDPRLTFSFDSSCWLFLYHFGVAKWLQENVDVTVEDFAFSGSSGGALVAGVLACKLDPAEVKDMALADFHVCQRNPFHMFKVGEKVLDHYLRCQSDNKSHIRCSGHLRILLTKVSLRWPVLQAEVASKFKSWQELFSCLRASMHVPIAAGVFPYPIADRGWYYDGMVWAALFVPWRAFDDDDVVVRVSACGFPNAQIGPRFPFPFWWLAMPPSKEVLLGMFWMGYRDAQEYFCEQDNAARVGCCERRMSAGVTPKQIERLRKHLRKDRRYELDENAQNLINSLQVTADKHWRIFFYCLSAVGFGVVAIFIHVMFS